MEKRGANYKICILLLNLTLIIHMINVTCFVHTHRVDFKEIVHSHPYSTTNHHSHTESEIQFIALISQSTLPALLVLAALLSCLRPLIATIAEPLKSEIIEKGAIRLKQLRAPPACTLS